MAKPIQEPTREESTAYATACRISASLCDRYPEIGEELHELLDAVKVEQRLATKRGCPIYTAGEEFADTIETWLRLGPKDPTAGDPKEADL